jgi:PDZ domain-containing secreted protein
VRAVRRLGGVALALLIATGTWWSGVLPCALVTYQPDCELVVAGGPVLDTSGLVVVRRSDDGPVREPAGRLLVTTIEVWEPDGHAEWWAARRDPDLSLVPRVWLVPPGADLADVADDALARMVESQDLALGVALVNLGLVPVDADGAPTTPPAAWPVTATFRTDDVGGPSAGLMLALSLTARLAPEDPTARPAGPASALGPLVVAGTGALEPDGTVGGVGGVDHKLRSVVAHARAGAVPAAFLLPTADLPVARRTLVARDVLLVPVDDLAGAIAALEVLAAGGVPAAAEVLAAAR